MTDAGRFVRGDRVIRLTTGVQGVVVGGDRHPFYEVAFHDDVAQVHSDELAPAVPDPASTLAAGTLGDPESYALRLQSQYLTHAYRYDRRVH